MNQDERGLTLIEILIALAIFAVIVVGALGAVGSTAAGLLEGFPTAFTTGRVAKDYTVASVYLQAFQEFVANKGAGAATDGAYCVGSGCSPEVPLPGGLSGYPTLTSQPYQLDWQRLDVLFETWYWDDVGKKYCLPGSAGCPISASGESIKYVRSTLTWQLKDSIRTLPVERFIR